MATNLQRSKLFPMIRWMSRVVRNLFCGRSNRYLLLTVFCFLGFFWTSGLIDHGFETSFMHFSWPSSSEDVFRDTHKLLGDEKIEAPILNSYDDLKTLHVPRCNEQKFEMAYNLLIIVKSSVTNSKNRDVIRETWGQEHIIDDFNVRTVFIVGRFPSDNEHKSMKSALEREAQIHKDVLIADIVDSYRNNTAKLLYSFRYATRPGEGCPKPDFVLFIDDDYMLSTHNLIRLLDQKSSEELLYEGWRFDTSPFRFKLHKHAVSIDHYPYDRYPPYISAGCVLLSRASLQMFYTAAQLVKVYNFDDIYTGILAHLLRIRAVHNTGFVFWSREVSHEEWLHGEVIAAHGYDPQKLEDQYPLVRFAVPG